MRSALLSLYLILFAPILALAAPNEACNPEISAFQRNDPPSTEARTALIECLLLQTMEPDDVDELEMRKDDGSGGRLVFDLETGRTRLGEMVGQADDNTGTGAGALQASLMGNPQKKDACNGSVGATIPLTAMGFMRNTDSGVRTPGIEVRGGEGGSSFMCLDWAADGTPCGSGPSLYLPDGSEDQLGRFCERFIENPDPVMKLVTGDVEDYSWRDMVLYSGSDAPQQPRIEYSYGKGLLGGPNYSTEFVVEDVERVIKGIPGLGGLADPEVMYPEYGMNGRVSARGLNAMTYGFTAGDVTITPEAWNYFIPALE